MSLRKEFSDWGIFMPQKSGLNNQWKNVVNFTVPHVGTGTRNRRSAQASGGRTFAQLGLPMSSVDPYHKKSKLGYLAFACAVLTAVALVVSVYR